MSLRSKLNVENSVLLIFSVFYLIVGGAYTFILVVAGFQTHFVGALAFLSFLTAYALIQMRKSAVLLTTVLFFLGVAFSVPPIFWSVNTQSFTSSLGAILFNVTLIAYIIMSLIGFAYVVLKKKDFG